MFFKLSARIANRASWKGSIVEARTKQKFLNLVWSFVYVVYGALLQWIMEVNIVNIKHAQIAATCYSTLGKFAFPTDGTVAKLVAVKASYMNIRV